MYGSGFQDPVSELMQYIHDVHDTINYYLIILQVVVVWVMAYSQTGTVGQPYTKFTHGELLEQIWTIQPAVSIWQIGIPSFRQQYFQDEMAEPEQTVKAIGSQWHWTYEYTDQTEVSFDSYYIDTESLELGQQRLQAVDNYQVLPITAQVRLQVTSTDVIHSFAVPSLGVKVDAIPGRLNTMTFTILRPGYFYGQCSELCGYYHAMMPIGIKAVPYYAYFNFLDSN